MPTTAAFLLMLLLVAAPRSRGRSRARLALTAEEDFPNRPPTKKEAADSGASLAEAAKMPWHPTHTTSCGERTCRPGEGNLRGYKMWGQPYIHREAWVQSRSRRWPHPPDPETHYAELVRVAKQIRLKNLVIMAAGDFDFREIVVNWAAHCAKQGWRHHLVLAMDAELHADLSGKGIISVDNAANLNAWNATCLTRHVQRVRMERQLATAALVAAGVDVLLTDATVIFVHDPLPLFATAPLSKADILVQREGGPGAAVRKIGVGVNAGFMLVRAARLTPAPSAPLARLFADIVRRGLVEFYSVFTLASICMNMHMHAPAQARLRAHSEGSHACWRHTHALPHLPYVVCRSLTFHMRCAAPSPPICGVPLAPLRDEQIDGTTSQTPSAGRSLSPTRRRQRWRQRVGAPAS